jgi:hypothetical protein
VYEYAGFDAPALREILQDQLPPKPEPEPVPTLEPGAQVTFETAIAPLLQNLCVSCHGEGGVAGLDLSTYESVMVGGQNGEVVIVGDAENSLIVIKLSGDQPHFAQFTDMEMDLLREWIATGASE